MGVWKIREWGKGENDNKREGGSLECKYYTYSRGITFSFLFANLKRSGRVIRVQIQILRLE